MSVRMPPPNTFVSIALCILSLAAVGVGCLVAIVSTRPADEAYGVPINPAEIRAAFGHPMARSSVERAFSTRPSVVAKNARFAWSHGSRVIAIAFPRGLRANTTYTFSFEADAAEGMAP